MAIEINVPDIGEDQVEVIEILVSVGDKVQVDQSLITLEGNKASIEVPSLYAGIVKEIKVEVGEKVSTGTLIMTLEVIDNRVISNKEVSIPDIGGDEVEVIAVLVKLGDDVKAEQSLITIGSDKTLIKISAPFAGTIKELMVQKGDKVRTGSLIMVFEEAGTNKDKNVTSYEVVEPQEQKQIICTESTSNKCVKLPDINGSQVTVTEIMVQVNEKISARQLLIIIDNNQTFIEVLAPFSGIVKEIKINIGDKISINSQIIVLEIKESVAIDTMMAKKPTIEVEVYALLSYLNKSITSSSLFFNNQNKMIKNDDYIHATPIIRRLAREFNINLMKVQGTGRKGRIVREDIHEYIKALVKRHEKESKIHDSNFLPKLLPWPTLNFSQFGDTEKINLGSIQKISGACLHRNWVMIPHVTQFDEADITEVEVFRKQHNAEAVKNELDVKLTLLVFILKAVAKALEVLPRFNSSLSADAQELILKKYINIGVAVDTPNGLVVPVLRNVNKKGIVDLSRELMNISKIARAGKLRSSDMQGGCFTISNLGGIGGMAFTPIVNVPEVAILGISKALLKPVWDGKDFTPRLMLPLSLSYDHRAIDGAHGARFISLINKIISDIRYLIM